MSRRGYSYRSGGSGIEGIMGTFVGLAVVLLVIAFVLLVRAIVFIAQTFKRYSRVATGLWRSLWVFCGSVVLPALSVLLFQAHVGTLNPGIEGVLFSLPILGFVQLLIVCLVAKITYRQTVMREHYNIVSDVLRKDWWSGYDDTLAQQQGG